MHLCVKTLARSFCGASFGSGKVFPAVGLCEIEEFQDVNLQVDCHFEFRGRSLATA